MLRSLFARFWPRAVDRAPRTLVPLEILRTGDVITSPKLPDLVFNLLSILESDRS